jgi:hypothetical protein
MTLVTLGYNQNNPETLSRLPRRTLKECADYLEEPRERRDSVAATCIFFFSHLHTYESYKSPHLQNLDYINFLLCERKGIRNPFFFYV